MPPDGTPPITGRCYCGTIRVTAGNRPATVAYCHCSDCRRVTGAPVAAFAAFEAADVTLTPDPGLAASVNAGVRRKFCTCCGTPLTAEFEYLPGQIYVPIGILDQAGELPPSIHCHTDSQLSWLHLNDKARRVAESARATLKASTK